MSAHTLDELLEHSGDDHKLALVTYIDADSQPVSVTLECETCRTIVLEFHGRSNAETMMAGRLALGPIDTEVTHEQLAEIVRAAKDLYHDGEDVVVDDDAAVSRGSEGAWVQAWVFVPNESSED